MKNLIAIIVSILLFTVFILVLNAGITKSERAECMNLAEQSREYTGWYATKYERAQCDALGLPLPPNNIEAR